LADNLQTPGGGRMPQDTENESIQTGLTFTNIDANGVQSPLAVEDTELELAPPDNAVTLILMPETNKLRVGKQDPLDGTAGNAYENVLAGNYVALDVSGKESVWVMEDSDTVTLSFRFITI